MSATDHPSTPVSVQSILFTKTQTWTEVDWSELEKITEDVVKEAVSKKAKLASFQPSSACTELLRLMREDYGKNAGKFPGRPSKISKSRRGGLIFLPRTTPIGTNFMIIKPIRCQGKSTIGGVEMDVNHYYVILEECDVHIEENGRLDTLAISDIQ